MSSNIDVPAATECFEALIVGLFSAVCLCAEGFNLLVLFQKAMAGLAEGDSVMQA